MMESADTQTLEGTWEELLAHSARFAGRRFRLQLLDAPDADAKEPLHAEGETLDTVLAPFLAEMDESSLYPSDIERTRNTTPLKQEIGELVAAKFRRQGFDV